MIKFVIGFVSLSPCLHLPVTLSTTCVTPTNEPRTSHLTQFTPNLPCDTQGRITFDRLEVSSDEFSFGDMGASTFGDTQEADFA